MATKTQIQTDMSEAELLCELNSQEAAEDEKIWQAKFDATPAGKLKRLADKVRADIQQGKVSPLDFTNQ